MAARRDGHALGSRLALTVPGTPDEPIVDAAWRSVLDVFAAVDAAMSRFREDSELTRLNRADGPVAGLSRMLVSSLVMADRAGRATLGRFDARVLSDLERLGAPGVPQCLGDGGEPPPIADVRASNRSGDDAARQLRVDRRTRTVHIQMPVDLGGIGKGLALRWAARAAGALLPGSFLIDAGGDIVCRGAADDGPWSIGIEDPLGGSLPVATCAMGDGEAIATSSIRLGRWLDPAGRLVHHLIDPSTGEPGCTGLAAVTVAWGDPAWAEVWSKALFLEGAEAIAGVARRRGLAAWWISDGGDVSMTPAARQRTTWVRGEGATG